MPVWATALEHARTEPINETANTIAADGSVTNTFRGILVACSLGDAAIDPPSRVQKNCSDTLAPCALNRHWVQWLTERFRCICD